jgi:hypothetical protein
MRGRNIGAFNGLGRGLGALTALFFGLGMSGFDPVILTTFSLAASRLPAADLPQAFRVLTVALVPAPWLVLASASLAQADPRARSPRSGQTVVFLRKLMGAHGRCFLPRESSGRMLPHSPRALSKLEQDACLPVYHLVENKTERQTVSSTRREQETQPLLTKRSSCREQDRETNGLFDAPGTRNPTAAHQTIESAAESEIGPRKAQMMGIWMILLAFRRSGNWDAGSFRPRTWTRSPRSAPARTPIQNPAAARSRSGPPATSPARTPTRDGNRDAISPRGQT